MERSTDFKTPLARVSFAGSLFTPRAQQEGAVPKYGCTLIFEKSVDRSAMDNAVKNVLIAQWGDKGLERAKAGLIKSPFLDGNGKEARNKKTGELHPRLWPRRVFPSRSIYPRTDTSL